MTQKSVQWPESHPHLHALVFVMKDLQICRKPSLAVRASNPNRGPHGLKVNERSDRSILKNVAPFVRLIRGVGYLIICLNFATITLVIKLPNYLKSSMDYSRLSDWSFLARLFSALRIYLSLVRGIFR